ncbi:hypothetical protein SLEP1_g11246 [Rubroshorea leprosula]|uniref:Uncharacterized protein n=1 Tax=Rubroshorea leprosula TaxID=152421 RepID=A0AAV5ILH7_9ROSI|nr:hypothetical protein SLEP1_g11246 [Rubroshorea leprosula]
MAHLGGGAEALTRFKHGKAICSEFAILMNLQKVPKSIMRVVYIAPLEGIAKEIYRDWVKKFDGGLGLQALELTGETTMDLKLLENGLCFEQFAVLGSAIVHTLGGCNRTQYYGGRENARTDYFVTDLL